MYLKKQKEQTMIKIIKGVWQSFNYALAGMAKTFKSEHMFRIYLVLIILALITEVVLRLALMKIAITIICGAGILSFELINTGVEKTVDALGQRNKLTAFAKDAAAGSVALFAIGSLIAVVLMFIDHFIG